MWWCLWSLVHLYHVFLLHVCGLCVSLLHFNATSVRVSHSGMEPTAWWKLTFSKVSAVSGSMFQWRTSATDCTSWEKLWNIHQCWGSIVFISGNNCPKFSIVAVAVFPSNYTYFISDGICIFDKYYSSSILCDTVCRSVCILASPEVAMIFAT